ncbi:MAG: UDP-N-acetylmuramoyl-tripeptide--D-alanyl-D-alanine ligase [Cyanobacteria bacterium SIG32]|nr:UDP-N-acetylmuramoyl-tripeptide--D-alanyl-D-alanine ligase [Cyanobacteria bacterium SIG32]
MREDEIVKATGAEVLKKGKNLDDYSFSTDTRTIKSGDIYLPLKGENFDGENFIQEALNKGAVGYFTTQGKVYDEAGVIFKVENTLDAYLKLANFYKNKINPKVVGITGSSGKTTTKEMVYSVVKEKFKTVKTFSNHNNEIGFCQTVFESQPDTEVLIIEMGMRGLGEIELISRYAEPDFAIVTNSGSAHIGRLGTLENIAKAKCEIAKFLNPNGAFIALNQQRIKDVLEYLGEKIYYSIDDVQVIENRPSYSKYVYKNNEYELFVEGDYNIENSLSAIEVGFKLGMTYEEIKQGLASYKPIEKRWEVEKIGDLKLINDSYNANPESMKASVKTFIELYENPVVVLGNMGELGENEVLYHREVGQFLSKVSAKNVKFLTVGNLASKIGEELLNQGFEVSSFDNNEQVSRYILDNLNVDYTIFLKASRSMKFEEIIEVLKRGKQ